MQLAAENPLSMTSEFLITSAVVVLAPGTGVIYTVSNGLLINILNPKLTIFFLTFMPQFVSHDSGTPTLELVGLSATFMAMTLVVFVCYGLLASRVRTYFVGARGAVVWLRRSFATVFATLGLKLAFSER